MTQKILVLAATGNVGLPLVERLLEMGLAVKAASRDGRAVGTAEGVVFNYADPQTYPTAFDGARAVYVMTPAGYPDVQEAASSVIRYATARDVKVVLQTNIEVDFDEHNVYRAVEGLLRESGSRFVTLRPNWFMDNFRMFWLNDLQQGALTLPVGNARTAFIDVLDIAASAAMALTSDEFDGQTFTLTGPESLSYREAVAIFSSVLGRSIVFNDVAEEAFVQQLVGRGMPEKHALFFASVLDLVRRGAAEKISHDVERLAGRPARSLRQYVEDNRGVFTISSATAHR